MMELVDMLGLGSSSEKSMGSSPFFGSMYLIKILKDFSHTTSLICLLITNFVKKKGFKK